MVGLVSAAAVDGGTGTQAQGQNFFIAARVIGAMLNEHNVKPAMSLTSQSYNDAVADFGRQHYKAALQGFEKAQNLYPGHPYAGHFISESQSAISAGKDRAPEAFPWMLVGEARRRRAATRGRSRRGGRDASPPENEYQRVGAPRHSGDTCDTWTLVYTMIRASDGSWLIDATTPYHGTSSTRC